MAVRNFDATQGYLAFDTVYNRESNLTRVIYYFDRSSQLVSQPDKSSDER